MTTLKKVTEDDIDFLYSLMNNKEVRKFLLNPGQFSYKEHIKYWKNFKGKAFIIYYKNKKVGLLREENNEISLHILPEYWNKGIGSKALTEYCHDKHNLRAKIKPGNIGSIKIFEKAGFKLEYCGYKKI